MNPEPLENRAPTTQRAALNIVADVRPSGPDAGYFRGATIGAIVGLLLVGVSVFAGVLLAGAGLGTALAVGGWIGFWGGGGFGFMLGATVPGSKKRPA